MPSPDDVARFHRTYRHKRVEQEERRVGRSLLGAGAPRDRGWWSAERVPKMVLLQGDALLDSAGEQTTG